MSQQELDYFSPPIGASRPLWRRGAVTIWTVGTVLAINSILFGAATLNGIIAFYLAAYVARDVNICLAVLSLVPLPWLWKCAGGLFTAIHAACAVAVPFVATHTLVALCDHMLPRC